MTDLLDKKIFSDCDRLDEDVRQIRQRIGRHGGMIHRIKSQAEAVERESAALIQDQRTSSSRLSKLEQRAPAGGMRIGTLFRWLQKRQS